MGAVTDLDEGPTEPRDPARPWAPSPFTRLARTHGLSVAGDAIFTTAMAGTVFFSANSLDEARGRVALTLLFTIAPFAVAAPLIGPLLDRARGGRRWMIIVIAALRALVCLGLMRHYDTWLLYPEGLLMLVLSKGYLIARGAVVPTVVRSDEALVKANARLTLLSGVAAAVAVVPAGILLKVGSPAWTLGLGFIVFTICTVVAFDLPKTTVATEPVGAEEKAELRSIGILVAASSMALVRGIVGFLSFLIAFHAKDEDLPALLAVGAVAGQAGFLLGAVSAPAMRRSLAEERILTVCLGGIVAVAVPAAVLVSGGSPVTVGVGLGLVSMAVGFASNVAKQAFDSIVQRDAPDANRGRSFAKFETRFQLVWVVGALLPVALPIPLPAALVFIGLVAAFALTSYLLGRRRAAQGRDHRIIRVRRRAEPAADEPPAAPPGADPADRTLVMAAAPGSPAPADVPPAPVPLADPGPGLLGLADQGLPDELADPPPSGLFDPTVPAPVAPPVTPLVPAAPGALATGDRRPDGSPADDHRATPPPAGPPPGAGAHDATPPTADRPTPPVPGPPPAVDDRPPPPVAPAPPPPTGAALPPPTDAPSPPPAPPGDGLLAGREPRWRDATTPHLPGFDPESLEGDPAGDER